MSPALIAELLEIPDTHGGREHYTCGPTEFMTIIREALINLGVSPDHVRAEDFAISLPKENVTVDEGWTFIGDATPAEHPGTIIAEINGEVKEVAAKEGQSVLETLLEAGFDPPYSCMNGSCMACLAKITSGRVYQEDPGILTDDNIEGRRNPDVSGQAVVEDPAFVLRRPVNRRPLLDCVPAP